MKYCTLLGCPLSVSSRNIVFVKQRLRCGVLQLTPMIHWGDVTYVMNLDYKGLSGS